MTEQQRDKLAEIFTDESLTQKQKFEQTSDLFDAELANLLEARVSGQKPLIVTNVQRAGRNSDYEWNNIKNDKMQEHLLKMAKYKDHFRESIDWTHKYKLNIEIESLPDDCYMVWFRCAFGNFENRLPDPAGYRIASRLLSR